MVKIGIISWRQGGGTNDYISPKPSKPWKKGLKVVQKGTYKGLIPFEKALISAKKVIILFRTLRRSGMALFYSCSNGRSGKLILAIAKRPVFPDGNNSAH